MFKVNRSGGILHAKAIQGLHGDESHSTKTSIRTRAIVPGPTGPRSPHQSLVVGVVTLLSVSSTLSGSNLLQKRFCRSLGLFLFLVFLSACNKDKAASVEEQVGTIKVGEVQTLTGAEASFGTAIHRGIEIATRRFNEAGGVNGRKIKLITLDDQGKSEDAATAVTKLVTQEKVVAVLGALASSRSLAMAPIAQNSGVPMITPTATNPKVTEIGSYIFRVCFVDPFQGRVMAKFALDDLKAKKVAIIRDVKSDYSMGLSDFFIEMINKGGGEIVSLQSYSAGDIDFKAQLTAIRGQNPDAVFVPGYYTEVGLIARQARELGIMVPLLGGDGWSSPKVTEVAGNAVENSFYSNHYSSEDQSPVVQSFVTEFKELYHALPDGIAALGYDSAMILFDAMKRAKDVSRAEIRQALSETRDFEGVTGTIAMDKNRNPVKSAVILKIQKGQSIYQTTIHP